MKKNRFALTILIAALAVAALACSFSAGTTDNTQAPATIAPSASSAVSGAFLASDDQGANPTTVFKNSDTFYFIVNLSSTAGISNIKAVWTAINVEGEAPNTEINTTDTPLDGNDIFTFNVANQQLWPAGKYKVDLYLNDKLDRTLEFEVK
jgi:hypothetical protein